MLDLLYLMLILGILRFWLIDTCLVIILLRCESINRDLN